MKKRYQINKERAVQQFNKAAQKAQEEIQIALPLPEVMALMSQGLMNLALFAFTKLAEGMMNWEVNALAGPRIRRNQNVRMCVGGSSLAIAL